MTHAYKIWSDGSCAHYMRVDGVCQHCGDCQHMYAVNNICTQCGVDVRKSSTANKKEEK